MNAKTWKKLQRMAYAFYGLTYAHIVAFEMPKALSGNVHYLVNVTAYSMVFLSYLLCRLFRAIYKTRKDIMARMQLFATSLILIATTTSSILFYQSPSVAGAVRAKEPSISVENSSLEGYAYIDGIYFGEGEGNNGKIKVQVTITGSQITDIQIVSFPDDPEYFDKEKDGNLMISQMLDNQSCDVDTVSGATYSSEGLIDAVKNALLEAIS
ncbi:FMN-binding protein [Butyrivibrio sp. VCB2006]|uniref:FMN-binding protein n=1 Tax=Butyrivibrio sp. VCB2006 TaxID=1280679 RepID=UPI00041E969F|nr:FMN-binding protein [Butyrivibrio sp. VCB2006]